MRLVNLKRRNNSKAVYIIKKWVLGSVAKGALICLLFIPFNLRTNTPNKTITTEYSENINDIVNEIEVDNITL